MVSIGLVLELVVDTKTSLKISIVKALRDSALVALPILVTFANSETVLEYLRTAPILTQFLVGLSGFCLRFGYDFLKHNVPSMDPRDL